MSERRLRAVAVASLAASLGFAALFFAAKHEPRLAGAAPFVEDPCDAVGSFAVQLAVVAASLSVLRALRRSGADRISDDRRLLILRGAAIALLAIFVALAADSVTMVRHAGAWASAPAGRKLAALLGILVLASAAVIGWVVRVGAMTRARLPRGLHDAAAIIGAGVVALAIYPEAWRRGVAGAILTAVFGMALLFVEVWGLARVLLPRETERYDDLLDEVQTVFGGAKLRAMSAGSPETIGAPRAPAFAQWLRAHHWRCVAAIAIAGGLCLAAAEALGEGLPVAPRRAIVVLGVFTGIEAAGIVLGYALFRGPLGLVRVTGRSAS